MFRTVIRRLNNSPPLCCGTVLETAKSRDSSRHIGNYYAYAPVFGPGAIGRLYSSIPASSVLPSSKRLVRPKKRTSVEPVRSHNVSYEQLSQMRKAQANRSVLVQVSGKKSCDFLHKYCCQFGNIVKIFYESQVRDYVLVEFDSEESALGLAASAEHFDADNVPVESRVLYMIDPVENKYGASTNVQVVSDGPREVNLSDLYNANSMQEQMLMYYHSERLTELETRLRYFVCSLLEDVLTPMFPLVEISPYGSSANRLGRHGSDLDMVLNPNRRARKLVKNSPLRYMTKTVDDERNFTQRTLRVIADILHLFVPHITQVQKIVHARVPIINFYHEATSTPCDISVNNDGVLTMSKLLYVIGENDPRFRPLLFALRRWAALNDLTMERPGPRFSNFMLTTMVLAFLQMRSRRILPPFSTVLSHRGETAAAAYTCADEIVLGDVGESADELVIDFFNFYADFDFNASGLSLFGGKIVEKPASSPLYIENPLDHGHNCAQNVHQKELEYLTACVRSTRDRLLANRTKSETSWGLLTLVESRNFGTDVNVGVSVRNLFTPGS